VLTTIDNAAYGVRGGSQVHALLLQMGTAAMVPLAWPGRAAAEAFEAIYAPLAATIAADAEPVIRAWAVAEGLMGSSVRR